ncbi:MAG TPA: polysaccharide biosynthesis/export family protein [Aridibacter sp.]|nr:polysaccharide biosynthesis/export family protein [Aridibacter sp.]
MHVKTDAAGGPVELPDGRTITPNLDRYRIGFEDVLQVTVFRHPELSQTISVAQDGTIILPRIDQPIVAVCKTERELTNLITELYKNYLRNPFVNVRAIEQRSQPFAVMGAVNKPGSFFLDRKIRLLELLAMAGGPDVDKSGQRIRVARTGSSSACVDNDTTSSDIEFFAYNVNDVLGGDVNPWMQPGDIVSVLEAEEAFVVGDVFEPAKITLKEPITLTQAIAKAGGINSTARTGKVKILRQQDGSTAKTELVFDLKAIAEKKAEDPLIQGNDIIEVPTDSGKVLKNGIFKVLAGGLGNLFYRFPL